MHGKGTQNFFNAFNSNFEGDACDLDLGDEVEYSLAKKTNKVSAETIRKLPRGSVAPEVKEFGP